MIRPRPRSTLFPYTTLFRSLLRSRGDRGLDLLDALGQGVQPRRESRRSRRSEEHTSELQSHSDLVCRLLLEKKNEKREMRERLGKVTVADSLATQPASTNLL